jgi:antitoxin (DNA-binding transcriptional repressor) of toxin-antitoxin stability system
MKTIPLEETGAKLADELRRSESQEPVVIVNSKGPVALVVPLPASTAEAAVQPLTVDFDSFGEVTYWPASPYGKPVFGSCKGMLTVVAEDNEHLRDFGEYMP